MALDPIKVVLQAVDQISQPLNKIAQQSEITKKAIAGISQASESVQRNSANAFRALEQGMGSIVKNSSTAQLAIARFTPLLNSAQQRFKLLGLEVKNQLDIAKFRMTDLQRITRETFERKYNGSFAQQFAQQIQLATPRIQEAANRVKAGLSERLQQSRAAQYLGNRGTAGGALLADARGASGAILANAQKVAAQIPGIYGKAAVGAGVAFATVGPMVGKTIGGLREKIKQFGKDSEESNDKGAKGGKRHRLSLLNLYATYELFRGVFDVIKMGSEKMFDGLIRQNIELRSQIQATSSLIVSSQDVLVGGKVVKDTMQAIKTAQEPIKEQVAQLRQDALEVSGVTSTDLVNSFQAVAQQIGTLKLNLQQAEKVTVRLSAQGTTLGLSAEQVNHQVQMIARGEIDTYNQIAKSIGLRNENLKTLAAEGKLYDYIVRKTEAGVQGQKLAAQSYAGVTSNIREIIELSTQAAGAPLLDAILKQLTSIYNWLYANQKALTESAVMFGEKLSILVDEIGEMATALGTELAEAFADSGTSGEDFLDVLITGFRSLAALVKVTAPAIGKFIEVIGTGYAKLSGLMAAAQEKFAKMVGFLSRLPGMGKILSDPIKDAQESLDTYQTRTNKVATDAANIQAQVIAQKKLGNNVSEDQLKINQKVAASARNTLKDLDEQIRLLSATVPIGDKQKQQQELQLELLRDRRKLLALSLKDLKGGSEEVTFQNKKLADQGNTFEQLAGRARAFKDGMNNTNDADKAAENAKSYTETLKDQITLGQISRESAIKELEAIAANEGLKVDARKAAEEQIQALRKEGTEKEKEDIGALIAVKEAAISRGKLGEVEGAKAVTALKKQQLDEQIKDLEAAIEREERLKRQQVMAQLSELEGKILEQRGVRNKALKKGDTDAVKAADKSIFDLEGQRDAAQQSLNIDGARLKDLKNQRDKLGAEREQAETEGERRLQEARLKVLERSQKKAEDLLRYADSQRTADLKKLYNRHLILKEELDVKEADSQKKKLQGELELAKKNLAEIEKLPKLANVEMEAARQQKIRDARQRTADITIQLLDNEASRQQAVTRLIQLNIERELKRKLNLLGEEQQAYERNIQRQTVLEKSLETQNKLLEMKKNLAKAVSDFVQKEYSLAEGLVISKFRQRKIQEEAARSRLAFLQREQEYERLSLKLTEQKNKALLMREQIQNRLDRSKAQGELNEAVAEYDKLQADPKAKKEDKEAALQKVRGAQDRVNALDYDALLLDFKGKVEEADAKNQRKLLDLKQQTETDQARAEVAKSTVSRADDVRLGNELLQKARNAPQVQFDVPEFNLPSYDEFLKGRPTSPDQSRAQIENNVAARMRELSGRGIAPAPAPSQRGIMAIGASGNQKMDFEQFTDKVQASIKQGFTAANAGNIEQTNNITNNINGQELDANKLAETVKQQTLDGIYETARTVKQQRRKVA